MRVCAVKVILDDEFYGLVGICEKVKYDPIVGVIKWGHITTSSYKAISCMGNNVVWVKLQGNDILPLKWGHITTSIKNNTFSC